MPANLTPEYMKAEKAFKSAKTNEEKIACLELMLQVIPKHKGTEHMRGDLRHRLSKLKNQQEVLRRQKGGFKGPRIDRAGAGQYLIVGAPNVGKSQLFNALTGLDARVAEFPFSTQMPQPGMMPFEDIGVQIVDGPPVLAEHVESWWIDMVRGADAALLLVDGSSDDILEQFEAPLKRLEDSRIYLVPEQPPEPEDALGTYVRTLLLATKCDEAGAEDRVEMLRELAEPHGLEAIMTSTLAGEGVEALRARLFEFLRVIRVYTRVPWRKSEDLGDPFTVDAGSTVEDVAEAIHKELVSKVKNVRVWGTGVYDGQPVSMEHVLHDKDIVEIHLDGR